MSDRFCATRKLSIALFATAATILTAASPAEAANSAPVVLVHGFAGFGRDEALGYKYWGGLSDLEHELNAEGRTTYTAVVGPFSSNWDRAVELYYQIKGGCVDYGTYHAAYFGHQRKVQGKCFPGLYPQWDGNHPIHLLGHSMGGQTIRMLVHLLEANGAPYEAGLFGGTKSGWVKSVTTVATPNNGTSLTSVVSDHIPFVVDLVGGIAGLAGIATLDNFVYNFKLDQWNLRRNAGEGFFSYRNRVKDSSIWTSPVAREDLSLYSLSPDGAAEENSWVNTWSNVYYFSYATKTTFKGALTNWEYPLVSTNALVVPFAQPAAWPLPPGIGNYTVNQPGHVVVDKTWWANDAVVNTKSMAGPWDGSATVPYDGTPQPGEWNYMGLLDGFDHFDVVGWTLFWNAKSFYLDHVNRLRGL